MAQRNAPLATGPETGGDAVRVNGTKFGEITIDGTTYEHDVVIRSTGEIVKRKKKLSKKQYGTSHILSKDEAKFIREKGCTRVILGTGQEGKLELSPEAAKYFEKKGYEVIVRPTPEALEVFNETKGKKVGLFHVTC
jgi:hypothetical protein